MVEECSCRHASSLKIRLLAYLKVWLWTKLFHPLDNCSHEDGTQPVSTRYCRAGENLIIANYEYFLSL